MTNWNVEYTDTYGGQANYCWVKRGRIETPERAKRALVMRRAKAAVGLSGVRGRVEDFGDMLEFRPYGMATVMFVNYDDTPQD